MADCGLYVHVPFCDTKCGYCDFYSVALENRATASLVECLLAETRGRIARSDATVRTVFVGGGTPTVLPQPEFAALFEGLRDALAGHPLEEFTVEANPATVDGSKLDILTEAGVDRISMGAQSWHASELETLERIHDPGDIERGVTLIRSHGINRLNLDLIFGIPGQSADTWAESLNRTLALGVDHLSCYGLTYEPGTRLTAHRDARKITPCDEGLETEMYLFAIERLVGAGLTQYEISAFAKAGQRCRHNLVYWRNESYIGVGPSAGGFVDGLRYKNISGVNLYTQRIVAGEDAACESERITGVVLAGEIIMMQLRMNEGIDLDGFQRRTEINPLVALQPSLERYRNARLIELTDRALSLTPEGRLVADTIIADFYSDLFVTSPNSV